MKTFSIALLLITGLLTTVRAQEPTDLERDHLKGKIKSITVNQNKLIPIGGHNEKGRLIQTSYARYNLKGNLTEFYSSAGSDTLADEPMSFNAEKHTYRYDKDGNLVGKNTYKENGALDDSSTYLVDERGSRIDWTTYTADGTKVRDFISEYDTRGNLLESNEYVKDKLNFRHTYRYDDKSNDIEERGYDEKGRLTWKETLEYDTKDNLIEVVDYGPRDSFEARYKYKYDDKNRLIEEDEYRSETSDKHKTVVNKYDVKGTLVEVKNFDEKNQLIHHATMDNDELHVIDISYKPNGDINKMTNRKHKYDSRSNEAEETIYDADGKVVLKYIYEFEYDKAGNWIKKTIFENDKPVEVSERKINYY